MELDDQQWEDLRYFVEEIVGQCSDSRVAEWDSEKLQTAISWASFFEQLTLQYNSSSSTFDQKY